MSSPYLRSCWIAIACTALMSAVAAQPAEHEHHQAPPSEHEQHRAADSQPALATDHVPPDPPQSELGHLSYSQMADMMQMDDREAYGRVLIDRAEWQEADSEGLWALDGQAYYGGDYHKLLLRTELERQQGRSHGEVELLWDRVITRWWNMQAGMRQEFAAGASRTWVALGIDGLAPYWFDIEATLLIGEQGRSALDVEVQHELLLSQRWVLQPRLEARIYGKEDFQRELGSGLSQLELGVRLRYEIRREFAPYAGVVWTRLFGRTADFSSDPSELRAVAGLRFWF